MLATMSISLAPSRAASSASATLIAVWLLPCGKPITDARPRQSLGGPRRVVGLHAGRGDVIAHREGATRVELCVGQGRMQERVVEHLRKIKERGLAGGVVHGMKEMQGLGPAGPGNPIPSAVKAPWQSVFGHARQAPARRVDTGKSLSINCFVSGII